jgi:hypothetical protein
METTPNGIIMILHEGFAKIDPQKCIDAMPDEWQKLDEEKIFVSYSERIELGDSQDLNFSQYALEHKRQYFEKILPAIEAYPNYRIVYFGLVPIPLGIHFGNLFDNDKKIEIYQWHHSTKRKVWYQTMIGGAKYEDNKLTIPKIPNIDQTGIVTALVRLSFSNSVTEKETNEMLLNAAELDYGFEKPDDDGIDSKEKMNEIGETIKNILDQLKNNQSGIKIIHLFASIPCGLAFLIGTKISANRHPYIQTYQYKNTGSPKYIEAILVNKEIEVTRTITAEDRKNAENLRKRAHRELREHIASFCDHNKEEANGRIWPRDVVFVDEGIMNEPFWANLPPINITGLKHDQCSKTPDVIENGFIRKGNKWHIDDYFFVALSRNNKIATDDNIRKAFRLFFFHEILHDYKHDLGDGKNENIGSFPKVIETADYQADVYAILNEHGFQRKGTSKIENPKEFFKETIQTAIETMWCFDDQGEDDLHQIQIRRLNRYLIWYWQLIRIEKSDGSLSEILKILEERPVIELTGLKMKIENNRSYYNLEKRHGKYFEMAIFHKNRVIRDGSSSKFDIEALINGIKKKEGEIIYQQLIKFYPAQ